LGLPIDARRALRMEIDGKTVIEAYADQATGDSRRKGGTRPPDIATASPSRIYG